MSPSWIEDRRINSAVVPSSIRADPYTMLEVYILVNSHPKFPDFLCTIYSRTVAMLPPETAGQRNRGRFEQKRLFLREDILA